MDTLLRDAEKKLATAQRTGQTSLDSLPLLYILGEGNSAKTTAVLKSGLDPELLAGQIYRDQDVMATPVVNLWYTQQCVMVEAGDAVRKSPALWSKLIRKTRPKAYRSAMGTQAPVRAAVVCISCEQFLGASASEAVLAAARSTNQMLRNLAQQLGTEVPVYVILTKLDRIPDFTEYVRNLTSEEASQPLGMAFARSEASSGLYAEKAMAEVSSSLDQLIFSLGEFRLELLTRESDQRNVDPVYEFPRELRKLRNNLASYLVELARPSHLNVNPYLRGFYFTGVRAHIVEQMVSAPARSSACAARRCRRHAHVLRATGAGSKPSARAAGCVTKGSAMVLPAEALPCRDPPGSGARWQARVTAAERMSSVASFLPPPLSFCWLILSASSFPMATTPSSNTRLRRPRMRFPPEPFRQRTLASVQELTALNQLRTALLQLVDYRQQGPPLMYRWGLYHGDQLLEAARHIYFDRFQRLLLANTQNNLVAALNALPAASQPDSDYNAGYNPLKAYLITTTNPDKSTREFLTPVLMQYWQNGRPPDTEEQKQLAQLQFDFYANELRSGNPYSIAPAIPTVNHARAYLASFGGFERIYQQMVNAANKVAPTIDFNRLYPGSASVVSESYIVPGAFTRTGFTFMQDAIQHPDRYFSGEAWVLGDQAPSTLDRAGLTQKLTSRYQGDYESQWRSYLHSARVVSYSNLKDASVKLTTLSNPNSPLLALICVASYNTANTNPDISKEFQPTQALVLPEDCTVKLMSQGNTGYINSLVGLQGSISQALGDITPNDPNKFQPVIAAAIGAHGAVSQTAQAFDIDPQAHIEEIVRALLLAPITSTEALAKPGPLSAGPLCASLAPLMTKFPFSPNATAEASTVEVAAVFQPGTGSLWQFYDSTLKPLLVQQGTSYAAALNAPQRVNPVFVQFFNKAASVSTLMYPTGATSPNLAFTAHILPSRGIQSVTLVVDAQRLAGSDVSKAITWSAQTAQQAQLIATYETGSLPLLQFNGPWALFHLIDKGHVVQAGNPGRLDYPLEVSNTPIVVNGTPLVVHIELSGPGASLLMPGGLSGLHCVPKVTQ